MKDLIKEVALKVAEEIGKQYPPRIKGEDDIVEFATAFLTELSKRAEAVAKVNELDINRIDWLDMFSEYGCGTKLFTFPPIHDIEPALSRYKRNMEGENEPDPVERLRFFLSLALHGQDWIDVEPFMKDVEAIESRTAEACAKLQLERSYARHCSDKHGDAEAIRSGEWRKYK